MTELCKGEIAQHLQQVLEQHGIVVNAYQTSQLLAYVTLLAQWNRVHNLTAVQDPLEMIERHILDSLSVLPFIRVTQSLLDVGAGAGLPSIPLAIMLPELSVTAIDATAKKVSFMHQAKAELGLTGLTIVQGRVEKTRLPAFGQIIARAFSSLAQLVLCTQHLLQTHGEWLAMKGQYPHSELEQLLVECPQVSLVDVTPLHISSFQRHVVRMRLNP